MANTEGYGPCPVLYIHCISLEFSVQQTHERCLLNKYNGKTKEQTFVVVVVVVF